MTRIPTGGSLFAAMAAAIAFSSVPGAPVQAQSGVVNLEVCNQTGARFDVAVGGRVPRDGREDWASVGWYAVGAGTCERFSQLYFAGSRYVYLRVEQASTGLVWEGGDYFCTFDTGFVIGRTDGADCANHGGRWVGFFEHELGPDMRGTVRLGN